MENNIFHRNVAQQCGGAVMFNFGCFSITNSTFEHNQATLGGALSTWGFGPNCQNHSIGSSVFEKNVATGPSGGALHISSIGMMQ